MTQPIAATCLAAALAAAVPGAALAQPRPVILLTKANGVVCSQISQLACWADAQSGASIGRLPTTSEWAMLGGDNAIQAAGQSNEFGLLSVVSLPSFAGSGAFPSYFTQYGSMRMSLLSVEDGSYTVGAGSGTFAQVTVGHDTLQSAVPGRPLRNPRLELTGGSVVAGSVKVGDDTFSQYTRSSGEVRLTGGVLRVSGDITGTGIAPAFITTRLTIDGGQLQVLNIKDFSELAVGSTAGSFGELQRQAGETASAGLLSVGVNRGNGNLMLTGAGASLTASQAVLGSGGGYGAVSLEAGSFVVGSLTLAQGAQSRGQLALAGAATTVTVTGAFDIGAGGQAKLVAMDGAHMTSADVRVGSVAGDTSYVGLVGASTHWEARDITVGMQAESTLRVAQGASLKARDLVLGPHATMTLHDGGVLADTLNVAAGGILDFQLAGANPPFETGFLVVNGTLHFEGRLQLSFVDGYAPSAGDHLQLLHFADYTGLLGADQVTVKGFDASRLDFSRLSVDGSVSVTAVPEPVPALLFGTGLVLLSARRRLAHKDRTRGACACLARHT